MKILAFMNSYSQGKSGGDMAFVEIFKRLRFKKIIVMTSLLGEELCENSGLKAEFVVTTKEDIFENLYFIYFKRIVMAIFALLKIRNVDLLYSSSDALPDVLPAFVYKLLFPKTKWILKRYHDIPRIRFLPYLMQKISLLFAKRADLVIQKGKFGFDHELIENALRAQQKYDAVFMGRLHESKGVFDLISIWENVVRFYPGAKLGIIGIGNKNFVEKLRKTTFTKYSFSKQGTLKT